MSHPPHRLIALGLLVFQGSACVTTWQRPNTSLAPGGYVAAEKPSVVLVITSSGTRVQLPNPRVAGDSLVAGQATDTVWDDAPVSLARTDVSDMMIVKGDEDGIEIIEVLTSDGRAVQVHRPIVGVDSVTGVVPAARAHRHGVPLADIKQIRVKRVDAALTTLAAVAGVAAMSYTAVMIAWVLEMN